MINTIAVSPRKAMATFGLFALLLISLPVNWHFFFGGRPADVSVPRSADALVGGHLTAAVTENYNQGFLLRDTGIDLFGSLSWLLFHEGRKGVLAGSDDWLFSAEEFETTADSVKNVARVAQFIAAVRERLAAEGSGLIVALIPTKASIYPEKLGRYRLPEEPAARYGRLLTLLKNEKIEAPDLCPPLLAAKAEGQVFLRTDTHWTPFGATVVAKTIAASIGDRDLGGVTTFSEKALPVTDHSGDLMRYVRVAGLLSAFAPRPDRLASFEAVQGEGGALLDDAAVPIVLIGTSYSANLKWSFEPALKLALSHDVMNVAVEGKGPFQPMSDYLKSDGFKTSPPKLVIWEIPERFVDDAYDASAFKLE